MKPQLSGTKSLRTLGNSAYIFGIALIIASLFTNLVPPTVASAHHANVSGSATCQNNGTYLINWSVSNWSDENGPMTITNINRSIGISVGTQVYVSGVSGSETVSNQTADIKLEVSGSWTNGNTSTNSASVKLKGNCFPPTPPPTNTPANTATNTPETPTNTPVTPTITPVTPTYTPETPAETPEKKVTICHVDGKVGSSKYQVLTIGYNAVYGPGGHLNEGGSTQAGHEFDFVIESEEDLVRCSEPEATPTHTPTFTPTNTPENTSTGTITPTNTPTITDTPTNTTTNTPTNTPTSTSVTDPFDLVFFCMGFRIISLNSFESSYAWSINGGPSGSGSLPALGYVDIHTDYYPGLVTLYAGQQLMESGFLPTDCDNDENTPTPPATTPGTPRPTNTPTRRNPTEVVKTLIPQTSSTSEILIPVTGVDLAGGSSPSRMIFNLGLGLLGLGLVLNGLSRNRKELEI
jgi:hypothetical protein